MEKIEIPSVPTMSVPAAGRLLGLGRDASYRAAAEGRIPVLRFGKLMRVPTAALRQMLGLDDPPPKTEEPETPLNRIRPVTASICGASRHES